MAMVVGTEQLRHAMRQDGVSTEENLVVSFAETLDSRSKAIRFHCQSTVLPVVDGIYPVGSWTDRDNNESQVVGVTVASLLAASPTQ